MKYRQLDKITFIDPGKRITAERTLRAEEEYLLDHFPRFPVMPGVMMLESLHQAAMWMIRAGDNFQTPLVILREVRGVKFGDFLTPGETLTITAETVKRDGLKVTVKALAQKGDRTTVSAKMLLELCSSADPARLQTDQDVCRRVKKQFHELFGDHILD